MPGLEFTFKEFPDQPMNQLSLILGIGLFGGIGSLARYGLTFGTVSLFGSGHPWGTFAANMTGCFLFGLLTGWFETDWLTPQWKTILLTGLLGGFTTFSAFAHENIVLLEQRNWTAFGLHFVGQTVLGLVAVITGLYITGIRH